jgi:hypothetical protein
MILNQDKTGFTIETLVGSGARLVFGGLTSEGKINGEALPRSGGLHRRLMTRGPFLELTGKAGWTKVKHRIVVLEHRNPSDVVMRVI